MIQYDTKIPDTVEGDHARALYAGCNASRTTIKVAAEQVNVLRKESAALVREEGADPEVVANVTLAYRDLESASMRLGKALQALDGGVSVYDRATTVGA